MLSIHGTVCIARALISLATTRTNLILDYVKTVKPKAVVTFILGQFHNLNRKARRVISAIKENVRNIYTCSRFRLRFKFNLAKGKGYYT